MRTLLKILISGLLLVLMVAVGAEVVALHHNALPDPDPLAAPVVVRKAPGVMPTPKFVRTLPNAPRHVAKSR
ncbi:hypothetical protein [Hymenobacter convexus]|uniref:hypothetical protein n=1 Tax=Hymenobacter sp. CA1UV-4 TaxID=3063782 RepID=UPI0027125425|nr:hypothetical protein [Hymenobacter sp. CA1UV-4]MDO7852182.1 hypothetical protein [Hymenobacter sp. CA1UV-4]